MKLLPNEEILVSSNSDKLILTNHRIQLTEKSWGQSFSIGIFIEDISSIEVKYKSNTILLLVGILCVLVGFYMSGKSNGNEEMLGGIFLGGILILIWWLSRKHVVSITSNGGAKLNFMVQGMGDEKISDFVHNVSLAKQTRVNQLAKI
jgi:hypothetical protein